MSRFPNPHMPFNPMQQQNTQQQSVPNSQVIMTPNGPMIQVLTPQGPMMIPYNPNMNMPMVYSQMPMQTPMMQNNMQYSMIPQQYIPQIPIQTPLVQQNRFENTPNISNSMSITSSSSLNNNINTSENIYRGGNLMSFSNQEEKNKDMKITKEFIVNIKNSVKVRKTNFTYNSFISEIKPNNIVKLNDNIINTDCFEEVIETIIEETNKQSTIPFISYQNFILSNNLYNVSFKEKIKEIFSQSNVKYIYKDLKNLYKEINNNYDYYAFNFINELLTSYINEFLQIIFYEENISIDSFIEDFNELLKYIRNNTEEIEDELINYLNNKFIQINEINDIIKNEDNKLIISEMYEIVYLNRLEEEFGLEVLSNNKYINIPNVPPNEFILSLVKVMKEKYNINEFYIVTLNRKIFKLFNYNNKIYISNIN